MSENTLYQQMIDKGISMDWYLRGKKMAQRKPLEAPLYDSTCCKASIYLLKENGTLWTLSESLNADKNTIATPHKQVRSTGKTIPHDIYVCVRCKTQFKQYSDSSEHKEGGQANV